MWSGCKESPNHSPRLIAPQGIVFCCDADALINLQSAGLLKKLRTLVRNGQLKMPEGVYRELQRQTDDLARKLKEWEKKYSIAIALDTRALELFRDIETKYDQPFPVGQKTYRGFWSSASGRKSADAQVVALAKAQGWIAISNDDSVHGACMLESVVCRRWEEIGRLLLGPEQPRLFDLQSNGQQ